MCIRDRCTVDYLLAAMAYHFKKYDVASKCISRIQATPVSYTHLTKLYDLEQQKAHDAEAELRKSQVGTRDRSEKIRTYNFPQGRVTDHRINLTLYLSLIHIFFVFCHCS